MRSTSEDLTTLARIRDAALALFASQGFEKTTIRQIAARAEVSPGLVMHHFGTKDKLHAACDEHVIATVLEEKEAYLSRLGSLPRFSTYLSDHPEMTLILDYLVTSLRSGGEAGTRLYGLLRDASAAMLHAGIASGAMKPVDDIPGTAALLTSYSIGVLLTQDSFVAALDGESLSDAVVITRYTHLATHVMGSLFTDSYRDQLLAAASDTETDPS